MIPCTPCANQGCTPEGLQFEPAAVGDGVATFVCRCACHPAGTLDERLAAERARHRTTNETQAELDRVRADATEQDAIQTEDYTRLLAECQELRAEVAALRRACADVERWRKSGADQWVWSHAGGRPPASHPAVPGDDRQVEDGTTWAWCVTCGVEAYRSLHEALVDASWAAEGEDIRPAGPIALTLHSEGSETGA